MLAMHPQGILSPTVSLSILGELSQESQAAFKVLILFTTRPPKKTLFKFRAKHPFGYDIISGDLPGNYSVDKPLKKNRESQPFLSASGKHGSYLADSWYSGLAPGMQVNCKHSHCKIRTWSWLGVSVRVLDRHRLP